MLHDITYHVHAYNPFVWTKITFLGDFCGTPQPRLWCDYFVVFCLESKSSTCGDMLSRAVSSALCSYLRMPRSEQIGLTPAQMALAWVYSREFVTSTIVGATSIDSLRENLRALNCPVTEEAHEKIVAVHEE